jgi:hypothetical protein
MVPWVGMEKTTVYLTTQQKQALADAARVAGRSEARMIRDGIESVTARHLVAEPAIPLAEGQPTGRDKRPADDVRRLRWMPRDEFVSRFVARLADRGLLDELRRMEPDTTDDVGIP